MIEVEAWGGREAGWTPLLSGKASLEAALTVACEGVDLGLRVRIKQDGVVTHRTRSVLVRDEDPRIHVTADGREVEVRTFDAPVVEAALSLEIAP